MSAKKKKNKFCSASYLENVMMHNLTQNFVAFFFHPCPAEPGFALPLQTV